MFNSSKFIPIVLAVFVLFTYIVAWKISKQSHSIKQNTNTMSQSENNEINNFPILEPNLFKLNIPEKFETTPQINKQSIKIPNTLDTANLTTYSYQKDNRAYHIGFIRYPAEIFLQKTNTQLLNDMRDGQIHDFHAILNKETTAYESNAVNIRELEMQTAGIDNSEYIRSRIIISEPYVFLLSFLTDNRADLYSTHANYFFESFKLFTTSNQTIILGQ